MRLQYPRIFESWKKQPLKTSNTIAATTEFLHLPMKCANHNCIRLVLQAMLVRFSLQMKTKNAIAFKTPGYQ